MTTLPPSPRRAKLVLLVLAIAIVVVGVPIAPRLWRWATTKTFYFELDYRGHLIRGFEMVNRWDERLKNHQKVWYYVDNGFLGGNSWTVEGLADRWTVWNHDGTVHFQVRHEPKKAMRESPPWWWGVRDQTSPSAPAWILDNKQWQAALAAQKTQRRRPSGHRR